MQVLKQFSIPIRGLKIGHHDYAFTVDKRFFSEFEQSPYSDGSLDVTVRMEKKSDHLILDMDVIGTVRTDCNRCSDEIDFPIESLGFEMLVKYDINEREEEEIIYINPESTAFNCAKLIYEIIILAMPLYKTCDKVDDKECDRSVLDHFSSGNIDEEEDKKGNPLTEALKNLKLN